MYLYKNAASFKSINKLNIQSRSSLENDSNDIEENELRRKDLILRIAI